MKAKKERGLNVEECMQLYSERTAQVGKRAEKNNFKVPAALAEILLVLHALNLTLSCTYLH